jgi:DNA-binding MarR family transcriptional regulator
MRHSTNSVETLGFTCLAYASRRTSRAVSNFFNARLKPLELTVAQFGLLAAIAKMPDRPLSAISDIMLLDDSTLARNLAVLERRGLVESDGGRGRGGKRVMLTPDGLALHNDGARIWRKANSDLAASLPPEMVKAGFAFLDALAEASEARRAKDEAASVQRAG